MVYVSGDVFEAPFVNVGKVPVHPVEVVPPDVVNSAPSEAESVAVAPDMV